MRTSRFWQALEDLGGAAPQYEWMQALGEDWAIAGALLRKTGSLAEDLICPRSSENGCLRQIVRLPDGKFRADCGDVPRRCDTLRLEKDEVRILALHRGKLSSALIGAFSLLDTTRDTAPAPISLLGRYYIRSGVGFVVFLGVTEGGNPFSFADLAPVFRASGPKAVLIPHASAIDPDLVSRLTEADAWVFLLDDVVVWHPRSTLAARFDPATMFQNLIAKLPGSGADVPTSPAIALPRGTGWSSIQITFENEELFYLITTRMKRAVVPADLGMADKRSGNARHAWAWLRTFAQHGGRVPTGTGRRQKQKQIVSERLVAFTGISEEPIVDEDGYYVAKFRISADGLSQGSAGRLRRTFVDDD